MFYCCLPWCPVTWICFALYCTVMYCIYAHIVQLYREGVWCVSQRMLVLFFPAHSGLKLWRKSAHSQHVRSDVYHCNVALAGIVYCLMLSVLLAITFWHSNQWLKEYSTLNWKFNHSLTYKETCLLVFLPRVWWEVWYHSQAIARLWLAWHEGC